MSDLQTVAGVLLACAMVLAMIGGNAVAAGLYGAAAGIMLCLALLAT